MATDLIALLGTTQDLARFELACVLGQTESNMMRDLASEMVLFRTSRSPEHLIARLGGTVKLLEPLPKRDDISESILAYVTDTGVSRLSFTLSSFSGEVDESMARALKQRLTQMGIKSRYRILTHPRASAGVGKQGSDDFVLYQSQDGDCVARTVAVQDIDYWTWKDRSRPAADPRSGMLPPKVARMMVNCALASVETDDMALLDPFCGSGTILMEAAELGLITYGSDISSRAVQDSIENMTWFTSRRALGHIPWKVIQTDVMDISPALFPQTKPRVIVFEGYLGPPDMASSAIPGMYKGLGKLYLGALKRLAAVIAPGGRIVCALPQFQMGNSVKHYDDLIDSCEKYGYTSPAGPFVYGRASARVKRRIYVLEHS